MYVNTNSEVYKIYICKGYLDRKLNREYLNTLGTQLRKIFFENPSLDFELYIMAIWGLI